MSLPDYQSLMLPVLRHAATSETNVRHCIEAVAASLGIGDADLHTLLPSGKQTVFSNRVQWAKSYLVKAGLLQMTARGRFKATPRGLQVLADHPDRVDNTVLAQFPEFQAFRSRSVGKAVANPATLAAPAPLPTSETATPEERIEAAFLEINSELHGQLLDRILAATPTFFEALIVDLMIAMGYGGAAAEAGQRLGRSGDGGIDGLINEDVLGLDSIFLQAKRYAPDNVVGVGEVREFAGALDEHRANKGVFVTTSRFAPAALNFAKRISKKLVPIDGELLTTLLVRHKVGVRVTRTIELKRLDLDYFEEE